MANTPPRQTSQNSEDSGNRAHIWMKLYIFLQVYGDLVPDKPMHPDSPDEHNDCNVSSLGSGKSLDITCQRLQQFLKVMFATVILFLGLCLSPWQRRPLAR